MLDWPWLIRAMATLAAIMRLSPFKGRHDAYAPCGLFSFSARRFKPSGRKTMTRITKPPKKYHLDRRVKQIMATEQPISDEWPIHADDLLNTGQMSLWFGVTTVW